MRREIAVLGVLGLLVAGSLRASEGYYRYPAVHGERIVFTAEGDLWTVGIAGGVAHRLTTHPGEEIHAAFSEDGASLAFSAAYEGPMEVYVMPATGGLPRRLTWEGVTDRGGMGRRGALVVGWAPDGRVLYSTAAYAGLPNRQLAAADPTTGAIELLPLAQAADGVHGADGTLFFARLPFQGSYAKRYKGGAVETLWRFDEGADEAIALTADYPGTSKAPMWWEGRVYFASDRDGTMNLWSMDSSGGDLRQHTHHEGWDVQGPSLSQGRIVYQLGADLRVLELGTDSDREVEIELVSDFDQQRERWVKEPAKALSDAHLSPDGDRVALTARGEVFVAPVAPGRLVHVTRHPGARYRSAHFLPDGDSLVALSDASGEVEWWELPADGAGERRQVTSDGRSFRFDGVVSPDGRWVATNDRDRELWLHDLETGAGRRVAASPLFGFASVSWSPDSRWLAYSMQSQNQTLRIYLYEPATETTTAVTSDRFDSWDTAFSPDGEWLYFLSDRHFESVVQSPWGARQPDPYFDAQTELYAMALQEGLRFPFHPADELLEEEDDSENKDDGDEADKAAPQPVEIDFDGLEERLFRVPVSPGNYGNLSIGSGRLYFESAAAPGWARGGPSALRVLEITNEKPEVKTLAEGIDAYELSADGAKLLVRKGEALHVVDAKASAPADLDKGKVDLASWTFSLDPREEWRQILADAWRLHRDYFYDPAMHGLDWPAVRDKYLPLVDRVTTRNELADLQAQMISELSALHQFVSGGDLRSGPEQVEIASLGARLERDEAARGYRVARVYASDPDLPDERPPLAEPGVDVVAGEVILEINGVSTLERPPPALLRGQAGRQVRLRVASASGADGAEPQVRDVIAVPVSVATDADLRYNEWEYTRRRRVEEAAAGQVGYVHLRAMGSRDIARWQRDFYPVYDRAGLIVDVRSNTGGNVDSWILGKLIRQAWAYWQARTGQPYWNQQFAFRGHLVVLVDEATASDGELFAEGFRRLGLGPVIGTRTWGGEIWLTSSNRQVDQGIATAPEFGVYGPEGEWLIEGHGVEPDQVVDNPPHATFRGEDAQLDAAVAYLLSKIEEDPRPVPHAPPYPRLAPPGLEAPVASPPQPLPDS